MNTINRHGKVGLGKQVNLACWLWTEICSLDELLGNRKVWLQLDSKNYLEQLEFNAYLILTSQTIMRGQIVGYTARNLETQRVSLNTFENVINKRVDIPEDIRKIQKTFLEVN